MGIPRTQDGTGRVRGNLKPPWDRRPNPGPGLLCVLVEVFSYQDGDCHMQRPPTSPALIPIDGVWSALATRTVSKPSSLRLHSALPTQSWQKVRSLILKETAQQTPPAVSGPTSLHFPSLPSSPTQGQVLHLHQPRAPSAMTSPVISFPAASFDWGPHW